ncbi:hypothetical protein V7S43_018694 [Phytophthora oleae]|uniref:Uncharacterized protein n=1 Tax=Phytophthora oleae TaxID=2107226 RepID=A0ABD3ETZ4_9STRA
MTLLSYLKQQLSTQTKSPLPPSFLLKMPPTYKWKTVCSDMAREDSQLLVEDMKFFIIV